MDETFIWVTIISSLFGIFGLLLLNFFWFKKQTFKIKLDGLKKRQDLEIKKLSKELGIPTGKNAASASPGINPNLSHLAAAFLPQEESAEGEGGILEGLMQYAQEHPDVAKAVLEQIMGKKGGDGGTGFI